MSIIFVFRNPKQNIAMKLNYTTVAINLYMKQTGKNLNELANMIGIGHTTLVRYAKGERLPDTDMLLRICNSLHLRIDSFFTHPDIELTDVRIYLPEEWDDTIFRYDRIEAVRLEKGWSKTEMIEKINQYGRTNITRGTYNHLITGTHFSYSTILGLLEATGIRLDYLFEQHLPIPEEDSVVVPRRVLEEKNRYMSKLENIIRELELKCKRLEKRTLPRYEERMENLDAKKVINTFIKQVERNLIELKSWTMEEGHAKPKLYGEAENKIFIAAEPTFTPMGNDEDFEEVK